ncbi:heterokaryon incompatibility protein-domain-containing protein [Cercophora newfieldiana]|uniref:Heterokaryon incompatibility protein-domain-containing protein n=1 Tax=Cercophora newfieldiana TaxID=92897 RepID=A0AA39XV22_9PEZI|nr:heterokaryon incompatibility protein-domain-containing protein [Cercophora newfieldiana]
MTSPYTDDAPFFAARAYPGCFTAAEVRRHLGQGAEFAACAETSKGEPPDANPPGKVVTPENHFLPNCVCAPLHSRCTGSSPSDSEPNSVNVTVDHLRYYAEIGCWFCSVIHGGVMAAPPWDPKRQEKMPMFPWFRMPVEREKHDRPDFAIKVFGDNDHNWEPKLVFYVDEDAASSSPCKLLFVRKEPHRTEPHQQLEFAAQHLKKCVANHACAPSIPQTMPTRLLQIQVVDGVYTVRLVSDISPRPYVTLSHCWGKSFPVGVTTTLENLETRHSAGISWGILPQTFRDAVAMTERLGFDHLWIDALCIIQNSPEDWLAESSRMHDVYSCCALMLSATASPDSKTGMFRGSNMSWRPWQALPTLSPPGVVWGDHGVRACHDVVHGIAVPAIAYRSLENLFHQRPLATRAWCYQEMRLARRVLHLSVDEALWDCSAGVVECQCGRMSPDKHPFGIHAWQRTLPNSDCTKKDKETLWMNTIYNYTERDLTFWTDRLPALSGLAKQFLTASKTPETDEEAKRPFREISLGTYLAGIWSASLPLGLCWYVPNIPGKRLSAESGRYIAPSWSWASVSGNVNWNTHDPFRPAAEILDIQCELAGPDETGSVCGGEVCLRAKLIPLKLFYGDLEIPRANGLRYSYMHLQARDPSTGQYASPCMYLPDYAPPQISSEMVLHAGADMIWGDGKTSERVDELTPLLDADYFGLQVAVSFMMVIRPAGQEVGVFERVGSVGRDWVSRGVLDFSKWFEGVDPQVVKVV